MMKGEPLLPDMHLFLFERSVPGWREGAVHKGACPKSTGLTLVPGYPQGRRRELTNLK